jgi:hypothetical protein
MRVDLRLVPAGVASTAEASAPRAVQLERAGLGGAFDLQFILGLPLNGRNFIQVAQLLPGTQAGTRGSITVRRGRGSVGQQDYDTTTYSFSMPLDSIAELRVDTNASSAELGGAAGAQVNVVTRRGGDAPHGSAWAFNANDALSQSWDAIAGEDARPPRMNRNQFRG